MTSTTQAQEEAKVLLGQLDTALTAYNADAVERLLSEDCVVIMTESSSGAKATRFFTKKEYLDALKWRAANVSTTFSSSTNQTITTSPSGEVFVARDADSRSRTAAGVDWIRSREAYVLKHVDGQLKISLAVTEGVFYFPDVPPEPLK